MFFFCSHGSITVIVGKCVYVYFSSSPTVDDSTKPQYSETIINDTGRFPV